MLPPLRSYLILRHAESIFSAGNAVKVATGVEELHRAHHFTEGDVAAARLVVAAVGGAGHAVTGAGRVVVLRGHVAKQVLHREELHDAQQFAQAELAVVVDVRSRVIADGEA